MATIKTVANLWKLEKQNKHAQDVAKRAGLLFDKFVGFLGNIEEIGKSLHKAVGAHEKAVGQLSTGRATSSGRQKNSRRWVYAPRKKFQLPSIKGSNWKPISPLKTIPAMRTTGNPPKIDFVNTQKIVALTKFVSE